MLLGTPGTSLLGNLLAGQGINKRGKGIHRAGEGIIRADEGSPLSSALQNTMDF